MRWKVTLALPGLLLVSALWWKVTLTPEYLCYTGDAGTKRRVIIFLHRKARWRARRLLSGLVEDRDPEVRRTAVACIGVINLKELTPTLLELARNDGDVLVRAQAVEVLAKLGAPEAGPIVVRGLEAQEPDMRIGSLLAAACGIDVPEESLLPLLKDRNSRVRETALKVVAELQVLKAVPVLAEDLEVEELFELSQTHEALQQITDVNKGLSKDAWLQWYRIQSQN